MYSAEEESLHSREASGVRASGRGEAQEEGVNPMSMYENAVIVFNFIISQWSLSPQAFKDAVLYAALAKCVLAVLWWTMRVLVAKFPASEAATGLQVLLNNRGAKLLVLVLDVTLIDVFLFFAAVALLDLSRGFSIFSLWTATLFAFLLAYMVIVAHADIKRY